MMIHPDDEDVSSSVFHLARKKLNVNDTARGESGNPSDPA